MNIIQRVCHGISSQVNYYCILMEGLFNTLGTDILGMNTIVPLFLSDMGASLVLVGAFSTTHSIISALVPLISGGFIAAVYSKRKLSLSLNGLSRSLILMIPVSLLLGFSNYIVILVFLSVMVIYFICQPVTGISWNYLLGNCVDANIRGKLVGTLFSISGFVSFASSNIVKAIRGSQYLTLFEKYAAIFGLAGLLMASSVLFFIPLKEKTVESLKKEKLNARSYFISLLKCLKNRDFKKLLYTNAFSHISTAINAFVYIFAQNKLKLTSAQISNMLVIQTVGIILGGFITGHISSGYGTKRMLILVESIGLSVPVLSLAAVGLKEPFYLMAAVVLILGFSRSGYLGYQTHLLEVAEPDKTVYYIVAKNLVMLPLSFISIAIGYYIEHFPVRPVFYIQIAACLAAIFCAARLRLIVYRKGRGTANE